jgi:ribosome-associated protein
MHISHLEQIAIEALNDLKALDLITIDIRELTTLADTMIICTGRSNRHVKSLAENVVEKAKQNHQTYIKTEGEKEGEWVIVDLADVIVHIMLPATRAFYNLEDLWEPIELLREQHANSSTGRR